jgi:putative FmdB family regulatory protein
MATYGYNCSECGRYFELMGQGVEDDSAPCSCGADAKRAFCSGLPAIRGETVGKSYANSGVITKHGYMDLNLFQEAHTEVLEDCARERVEPPDFLQVAKERVASGEAGPSRIAK